MSNEMVQDSERSQTFTSDGPGRTPGQAEGEVTPATGYDPTQDPGRTPGQAEGEPGWVDDRSEQPGTASRARDNEDVTHLIQEQFEKLRHQLESGFRKTTESAQWEMGEGALPQSLDLDEVKRWASLLGGGFLALYGMRRSLGSLTLIGVGAGMIYYALTGQRPLSDFFRSRRPARMRTGLMHRTSSSTQAATIKNIIVHADISDVYRAWADFENFPQFMQHIESVTKTGPRTSHWIMAGPFSTHLEWDAETTRLEENKRIAWNSTGGDIKTSGQVTFNPLPDNEVEVTVMLKYVPPAGLAGEVAAELFGDPEGKLLADLRNFKHYIEHRTNGAA